MSVRLHLVTSNTLNSKDVAKTRTVTMQCAIHRLNTSITKLHPLQALNPVRDWRLMRQIAKVVVLITRRGVSGVRCMLGNANSRHVYAQSATPMQQPPHPKQIINTLGCVLYNSDLRSYIQGIHK